MQGVYKAIEEAKAHKRAGPPTSDPSAPTDLFAADSTGGRQSGLPAGMVADSTFVASAMDSLALADSVGVTDSLVIKDSLAADSAVAPDSKAIKRLSGMLRGLPQKPPARPVGKNWMHEMPPKQQKNRQRKMLKPKRVLPVSLSASANRIFPTKRSWKNTSSIIAVEKPGKMPVPLKKLPRLLLKLPINLLLNPQKLPSTKLKSL